MLVKIYRQLFKNHYSDFVKWAEQMPVDTPISVIKKQQPAYIIIDWDKPEKIGIGYLYPVIKIKGHNTSRTQDFLGFVDDLYSGLVFRK